MCPEVSEELLGDMPFVCYQYMCGLGVRISFSPTVTQISPSESGQDALDRNRNHHTVRAE